MITLASEVTEWHISVDDLTFDVGKSTSYIGKVVVGKLTRRRNDRYLTLIQYAPYMYTCLNHTYMSITGQDYQFWSLSIAITV